ncbi:hypothetical protein JAAARDRAFT_131096 [Jaapia argillacea MUCL 33604]|uniref:ThuA-like domain-containing protein n=1 Tax=Jaapia argillacea MUCL 33604 TaxID=933084 RepID=A0A067Q3T3_9AGAM|nr:hypothetical protein JAAARDRAFT_131096 [Jaapia argillacea MUCL 33604]
MSGNARVLIYSLQLGYYHDSTPIAVAALKKNGPAINVTFDSTEDPKDFNDANLDKYDAVLFLDNTGEVLDEAGKAALQKYLDLGGNFVGNKGVHAASACLYETEFFRKEIGAYFDYHPDIHQNVDVLDSSHPSTTKLPSKWRVMDEMYNFMSDPREVGAKVLLAADESSYADPGERKFNQGSPHPIAWCQERGAGVQPGGIAGRSFYTGLGHTDEIWEDEQFLSHLLGGISWALESKTTRAFNAQGKVGNAG